MRFQHPLPESRRQRGSIALMLALFAGVMVLMLGVVDIGFMYLTKREYQKAADLAAVAGAQALADPVSGARSCNAATAAASANAALNLSGAAVPADYDLTISCGAWQPRDPNGPFIPGVSESASSLTAVRATVSGRPHGFFIPALVGRQPPEISAQGTAAIQEALASLRIRSTLIDINTQADEANLIKGICVLLGQAQNCINASAAGWQGVANAEVTLRDLVELQADAANLEELLDTELGLIELLDLSLTALERNSGPAGGEQFLNDLRADLLGLGVLGELQPIRLGELLNVASNVPDTALDVGLNVAQLALASIQAATRDCAVCVAAPISLPGLAGISVHAKVIEPEQIAAIGIPELATAQGSPPGSTGPNRIHVNTAQARALVRINVSPATDLLDGVEALLGQTPVLRDLASTVSSLISLNIVGVVDDLLGLVQNALCLILPGLPCDPYRMLDTRLGGNIDLLITAADGRAYVTDYDCSTPNGSSLDVNASKSLATVSLGSFAATPADVLSSSPLPAMDHANILEVGFVLARACGFLRPNCIEYCSSIGNINDEKSCRSNAWVSNKNDARFVSQISIKLKAKANLVGSSTAERLIYETSNGSLPPVGSAPAYQNIPDPGTVSGLLNQIQLELVTTPVTALGHLSSSLVTDLTGALGSALGVLDQPVAALLGGLGVDLNNIEVGANMTCNTGGATLVN
jgi:uncharacterized membrane protein